MNQEKPTRLQRSVAKRAETAERYSRLAQDPKTPWLLGKLARLESHRQRPTEREVRITDRAADRTAQSRARSQEVHEQIIAAAGELRRARAGEPRIVPQSNEVISHGYQQEVAEMNDQAGEHPQPPQDPEQQ